jgi:hypothetical protein
MCNVYVVNHAFCNHFATSFPLWNVWTSTSQVFGRSKSCGCFSSGTCRHWQGSTLPTFCDSLSWCPIVYNPYQQVLGEQVKHLGYFATEEDAARAFDRSAIALRGPSTELNFPMEVANNLWYLDCKPLGSVLVVLTVTKEWMTGPHLSHKKSAFLQRALKGYAFLHLRVCPNLFQIAVCQHKSTYNIQTLTSTWLYIIW